MIKNGIIIGLCICLLVQAIWQIVQKKKVDRQMEQLITYLTAVQDSLELPQMAEMKEGTYSILQSEIYKVVVLLREAYAREKNQKRYLAELMSNISHQIKTPIAAISIMTELLETPDLTQEQRLEYAGKIDQQANRITWLIRNLLNDAQLEAGVIALKREPVLAETLIRSVKESLEIMAEVKGVALDVKVDVSIFVNCDERWMTEALLNITKNCVEHTQEGGTVWITVSQDNIATHIQIRDNGEGISEEHLPHIFERFYKAGNASSDSVGIGLAMAKQIILKQNGTIHVESKKGEGTVFSIKLFRMETV
ncbi:MAG: sensor histidine kinase [Lachnospiraceae bacterium]